MDSTSKIIMVNVENSSFEYDLTILQGYPSLLLEDPLISETCPLEATASHHVCSLVAQFLPGRIISNQQ